MRLPDPPITPTIVFDLDGTLVHTVPDIAAALDIALAPYNVGSTTPAEAATMMGDGLSEFFWRALVAKRLNLPALEADAARKRFIEAYSRAPAKMSEVYPGIRELLQELRDRGVLMAVCTNKVEAIALDILELLELARFLRRRGRPARRPADEARSTAPSAGGGASRAAASIARFWSATRAPTTARQLPRASP